MQNLKRASALQGPDFGHASEGANPHTRSIYEKNYLRYSVFFQVFLR